MSARLAEVLIGLEDNGAARPNLVATLRAVPET
jgi:hypothetical protein